MSESLIVTDVQSRVITPVDYRSTTLQIKHDYCLST